MNEIELIISDIKQTEDYEQKRQMVAMLLTFLKSKRIKAEKNNKEILSAFALSEIENVTAVNFSATNYKEKSLIFMYADLVFDLVMAVHQKPQELPPDKIASLKNLSMLMEKDIYVEHALVYIFSLDIVSIADVDSLIKTLSETTDEYEKSLLYAGLLHYKEKLGNLLESSKEVITSYISAEMERYINKFPDADEDFIGAMETACDACKYFLNDSIISSLCKILELRKNNLSFFAVSSLIYANKEIPCDTLTALANDLVYADSLYHLLKQYNKAELFPAELANEEYLAKSDLVHWLTYPTELGKAPDEIEYIGKTDIKKEIFYVFKFKSGSDTLCEEQKNKWLIGWSSNEGGTFSNFDEYEKFDKGTPEKTLKYIKKKLL